MHHLISVVLAITAAVQDRQLEPQARSNISTGGCADNHKVCSLQEYGNTLQASCILPPSPNFTRFRQSFEPATVKAARLFPDKRPLLYCVLVRAPCFFPFSLSPGTTPSGRTSSCPETLLKKAVGRTMLYPICPAFPDSINFSSNLSFAFWNCCCRIMVGSGRGGAGRARYTHDYACCSLAG